MMNSELSFVVFLAAGAFLGLLAAGFGLATAFAAVFFFLADLAVVFEDGIPIQCSSIW